MNGPPAHLFPAFKFAKKWVYAGGTRTDATQQAYLHQTEVPTPPLDIEYTDDAELEFELQKEQKTFLNSPTIFY